MLAGPESDEYALLAGQMREIRVLREFTYPNEDYPDSKIQSLAGHGLIKAEVMVAVQRALPHVLWLDIENAMFDWCSQKSAVEPNRIEICEVKTTATHLGRLLAWLVLHRWQLLSMLAPRSHAMWCEKLRWQENADGRKQRPEECNAAGRLQTAGR